MKKNKSAGFFQQEKWLQINRIMRLVIWMVVCLNLGVSAKGYSQADRFSIQGKSMTVKEVFDEVMKHSDYRFFYNNEFNTGRRVDIELKNAPIGEVMGKVLEGQGYSYKLMDNYVLIRKDEKPVEPQSKYARHISGIVKDTDGNPLPGVSVALAGTTLGVATDADGKFKFVVPGPGALLRISFIGKKVVEIIAGDQSYFDITLEDEDEMLEEVVCTGIQTLSRERATGSFERLDAEALNKTLTSDVVSRLEGKIAGVQIDQNNNMTIRGRSSLYSNTEPLVVVDGFPIEAGLSSVNPDDIANITVLKDAAAASIWGVRAANGVIVITTKAGQNQGKPNLDISYFFSINSKDKYKDLHLLSPADAVDWELEKIQKGWWTSEYVNKHQAINKVQEIYYNTMQRLNTSAFTTVAGNPQFRKETDLLRKNNLYKQFEKELLRHAITNRVNLSYRGGGERSNYYLSAVYDHQSMGNIGDQASDLLLNFKHDYKVLPRLTFSTGVNVHYNKTKNNGIGLERLEDESPFHNLLDAEGNRIQYYMVDPYEGKNREEMGYLSYTTNLLDEQETNDNATKQFSTRLQAALKLGIISGMDIETRFQYERAYTNTEQLYPVESPAMRQLINNNTIENNGQLTHNIPLGGRFDQLRNELEAWTWRSQLTYNGDWNDSRHLLALVLGHEMRMYRTTGRNSIQFGYDPQALTYVPIDENAFTELVYKTWYNMKTDLPALNSSSEMDNRDISVYLNASYTFDNRYSLSASGRVDQSNLFGNDSDYKYNFIWSTGLSWRISEESFARTDWMDQLLLRVTYGIGGNVNKQFFPVLMGEKWVSSGVPYIILTNPANKDLTWEKTTTLNAGVDFAFFNHRLGGSLDYYHKKSTDLLGRVALDPTNGWASATMNFASVLNQGVELTVNTIPLRIGAFSWNLGFNLSYNKNEVKKVEDEGSAESEYIELTPTYGGTGVAIVGKPLGRLYSYRYAGLNDMGEVMLWQQGNKTHYSAYNREVADLKHEGTTEAPWYGGVNTAFEYKGITLSANATCKFGHKFRLPVGSISATANGVETIADRWQPGHTDTDVPVLLEAIESNGQYEMESYYALSDRNIRNAAYIRLNEVALGYSLPKGIVRKTPFKSVNVQFQARNLALWTANKEKIDPEAVMLGTTGFSNYGLPQAKSFILGIKLSF